MSKPMTKEEAILWVRHLYQPDAGQSWAYVGQKTGWGKSYANLVGRGVIEPSDRKMRQLNAHLNRIKSRNEHWVTPSQIPRGWNEIRQELGLSHKDIYKRGLDAFQKDFVTSGV